MKVLNARNVCVDDKTLVVVCIRFRWSFTALHDEDFTDRITHTSGNAAMLTHLTK